MAQLAMLADMQRTVYPEVTRQLHVMAQARENSPVIDQRSNHCATYDVNAPHVLSAGKVVKRKNTTFMTKSMFCAPAVTPNVVHSAFDHRSVSCIVS